MECDSDFLASLPSLFQETSLPTIGKAYVCSSNILSEPEQRSYGITTVWKQNSYKTSETLQFETMHIFSEKHTSPLKKVMGFPSVAASFVQQAVSPSLSQKAIIKKQTFAETSKKDEYILEIWFRDPIAKTKSYNLSKHDQHGSVHSDSVFSSLQWSHDETSLLYVAEKVKDKCKGFFEEKKASNLLSLESTQQEFVGDKFVYEESWGELLTEVTNPVICIFNLKEESLSVLTNECLKDLSPAQPQWGPDNSIVFEGISNKPFRLGRIYCEVRPSLIYQVHLNEKEPALIQLSENKVVASSFCPRVSHCMTKVVFLQNNLKLTGTPHRTAENLFIYNFEAKSLVKIFPLLNGSEISLFSHELPELCWLDDNQHIVLPLTISGETFAGIINTENGMVIHTISCTSILSVKYNLILMSHFKLDSKCSSLIVSQFSMGVVKTFTETQDKSNDIIYGNITDEHGIISHYLVPNVKSIDKKFPLVVYPHGGPHSVYTDNFNRNARMFCKMGYTVLLVNYRGSTGFTLESLESLPGNVGMQDVCDVQNFVIKFLKMYDGSIDKRNIFVFGGSHGGFLGAHLVGQFPDFYAAAALINPVIDIASMIMVTDIPDWCYVEGGLPFTHDSVPNGDIYKTLVEKSPVIYVPNVKAPILLCIGGKDLRVPPSQGKAYFRLLKANNKVTKLLLYPNDSHPLSGIETDGDYFLNVCKWFYHYKNS